MATKKKAAKFGQKAAFVRSLPPNTPAKEVVAQGKKKGITLTEAYVYTIRSSTKAASARKAKGAGGARAAAAGQMGPAETQLRNAIADLGLVKATQILESVRATIRGR